MERLESLRSLLEHTKNIVDAVSYYVESASWKSDREYLIKMERLNFSQQETVNYINSYAFLLPHQVHRQIQEKIDIIMEGN